MSWRFIIIFVLILAGISALAGVSSGNWLIAHAPVAANIPNSSESDPASIVDANGKLILSQPPQPLVNGGQGIPLATGITDWHLNPKNAASTKSANAFSSSGGVTTGVASSSVNAPDSNNPYPARSNTRANSTAKSSDFQFGSDASAPVKFESINPNKSISLNQHKRSSASGAWQGAFASEASNCRQLGFNERPACLQRVRQQYCGTHNAWGRVADCPAR